MAEQKEPKKDVYRPPMITTVIGSILGLATVIVIILVMVWVSRPAPPPPLPEELERRTLEEVRAEEIRRLHSYDWIDREEGIVRIPLERAMELVIHEARDNPGTASETDER